MKTTVTVREFDDEGRMVKETITETDDAGHWQLPVMCTCPNTYCQLHGYHFSPSIPGVTWNDHKITCADTFA